MQNERLPRETARLACASASRPGSQNPALKSTVLKRVPKKKKAADRSAA